MCDGKERSLIERLFGRQLVDSGTVRAIEAAGEMDPIYFPTNPFGFRSELGFVGARYLDSYAPVVPVYSRPGYGGILPLKEQPRLELPLPYRSPVLF